MSAWDLEQFIEQYHHGVAEFVRGKTELQKELWSHRDDVSLANPLGPPARGWQRVEEAIDRAAATIREGKSIGSERVAEVVTADLAYIVEIEQALLKAGDAQEFAPISLRATTIFRRENDGWKVVHRHADSTTTPRSLESVLWQTGQ